MKRRTVVASAAMVLLPMPFGARSGSNPDDRSDRLPRPPGGRLWRIATFAPVPADPPQVLAGFIEGLRSRGWVQGVHYTVERHLSNDARRYPAMAAELVAQSPDVVLAIETTARALRELSTTIPIVLFGSVDPVRAGLVNSLAQPGTNVTGISWQSHELASKSFEMLLEIAPRARHVIALSDPRWSQDDHRRTVLPAAARSRQVALDFVELSADASSLAQALRDIERSRPDALLVPLTGGTTAHAPALLALVRRMRLPAVGAPEVGGLAQIEFDLHAAGLEAADFVHRILHGAKAADMPVRQTTRFHIVANKRLAAEIGVKLPYALLVRAERVIE